MRKLAIGLVMTGSLAITSTAMANFYQQAGDDRIWYTSGNEYCHVTSPAQLKRLGGQGKVKQVKLSDNIFSGRDDEGECAWPQGFYQKQGEPQIYMIKNDEICHVASPDQLQALGGRGDVLNVPGGTELRSGLDDIGECRWP